MPKDRFKDDYTVKTYLDNKEDATRDVFNQSYQDYIKTLTHEQVVEKISKLTTENYVTQQEMSKIQAEIKECEKVLNIECTPEAIVEYKKQLDKSMRSALHTIALAEEALLEEAKEMPDDTRRKWLEEIIQQRLTDIKPEGAKK